MEKKKTTPRRHLASRPQSHASAVFKTAWGWMGLAAVERGSRAGVSRVVLPRASRRRVEVELLPNQTIGRGEARRLLGDRRVAVPSRTLGRLLAEARSQLAEFLTGQRRDLDLPLLLDEGTAFQRHVWRAIVRIPYGRARSYKWVAARVGGAQHARAVGMALGANPVPLLVPCHRVVAHDASLGGFTGGLQLKRRLLELEGTLPLLKS